MLAAVRGDFFTRLASLPGLGARVSGALFLLRPLTPDRLRDIPTGHLESTGLWTHSSYWSSSELIDAIRNTLIPLTVQAVGASADRAPGGSVQGEPR